MMNLHQLVQFINSWNQDNAISPEKPPTVKEKVRLAVGARVKVIVENEDKEGLYFDDDREPW